MVTFEFATLVYERVKIQWSVFDSLAGFVGFQVME